ncbi:MAG: hypothetical protein LCI00_19360 [Chloroflexi bacterium]|nr:hypothetical protein [Chloroflexota bacterium]
MSLEHTKFYDLDYELVSAYANTFISRLDTYPVQNADGSYVRVKRPLVTPILEGHIKGHITIGAYALNEKNEAHWICFDADDNDHAFELSYMASDLRKSDITTYLEKSRRGCHLWFFTPSISGVEARRFGKQLLREYKIEGVELYPKQDKLITGTGSLVRLPLGIHQVSKYRYGFIDFDGHPLAPTVREQMKILTSPKRVPQTFIDQILAVAPEAKPIFPTKPYIPRPKNRIVGDTLSERIKNRISVYDFISQYIEINERGFGYCPYHDDQKMSFGVNQEHNFWNCFACETGGSVIDFWMKWRALHGQDPDFRKTMIDLIGLLNM